MGQPLGRLLLCTWPSARAPPERLGVGEAHVQGPKGDVIEDGGAKELVVGVLKDEPHPGAHPAGGALVHLEPRDAHPALASQEAVQVQEERGLARAVGPHEGHLLPRRDG